MAKNPPTTSSANLKAAQTLRSCRLPSIHPGNFERSIRCDDRNERAFENEDPRAYSCTAYPDFDSNGSATSREKAQDRCAALRLNFLFHWSSLRSKLESRFERGALNDEQPKILPCRNPCGLGGRRKTALGWSNARPGPRPANDRPSCSGHVDAGQTAAAKPDFRILAR